MTIHARAMSVEAALSWAYRDELPKLAVVLMRDLALRQGPAKDGGGWNAMASFAEMLTCIDDNRYGVVPDLLADREPHPDAIVIADAVAGLDGLIVDFPTDWRPLADLEDIGPEVTRLIRSAVDAARLTSEQGGRLIGDSTSGLVRRHALARTVPDWRVGVPELRFVSASNGQPRWFVRRRKIYRSVDGRDVPAEVEEDGMNPRLRRPYADAYRKPFLDPDAALMIEARVEYETWHAALGVLVEALAHRLASIALLPVTRSCRPWMEDIDAPSTAPILRDLTASLSPGPTRDRHGR